MSELMITKITDGMNTDCNPEVTSSVIYASFMESCGISIDSYYEEDVCSLLYLLFSMQWHANGIHERCFRNIFSPTATR